MTTESNGMFFPDYFLFNKVPIFSLYRKQSHLHSENKTTVRTIVLTWKAVIEFDSNDKITICRNFAPF